MISNQEQTLNEKFKAIAEKTEAASVNFSSMVEAGDVTNKNLSDVYGTEQQQQTQTQLATVMETVRSKLSALENTLTDLRNQLSTASRELETINQQLRSNKSDLSDYTRIRNNASYDMTIYRRKLEQEGYTGPF